MDLMRASEAEKKVLFAMAVAPEEELSPSDLKNKGTATILDRLVKKDLVVKVARGRYRLYNPLFKAYLRKVSG